MIKKLLSCSLLLLYFTAFSQVGIGTTSPDPAAVLDINSQIEAGRYGGLKLPTVTLAQRAQISTPVPDGLMLYVVDGTSRCVQVYDATIADWMNVYCMNQIPVASAVDYTGTLEVGETLTASYTYSDAEGNTESGTTFQWYRATDVAGTGATAIAGADAATYVTTAADGGSFIAVGVTPQAGTGASPGVEVLSDYKEVLFKPTIIEFDPQLMTIAENATPDNVDLTFVFPNVSTTAVQVTVVSDDYSRLAQTAPVVVTIPANQTSPYTTTVFNVVDNALTDGNADLTFTITNVTGGLGANSVGANSTFVLTIIDDETAPVLLAIQDFEVVPATPTLNYVENTAGFLSTGNGTNPNTATYIGARSYGVTNSRADIDFGPVNTTAYTSATLKFRLASFSINSPGNGADNGDYVDIYISDDNGATFSYELEITGNNNSRYDFSSTGAYSLIYDGDNTATIVSSSNATAYSTIEITGLPATANLVVGIVMRNNDVNELWVIDNVEIYGNQ